MFKQGTSATQVLNAAFGCHFRPNAIAYGAALSACDKCGQCRGSHGTFDLLAFLFGPILQLPPKVKHLFLGHLGQVRDGWLRIPPGPGKAEKPGPKCLQRTASSGASDRNPFVKTVQLVESRGLADRGVKLSLGPRNHLFCRGEGLGTSRP